MRFLDLSELSIKRLSNAFVNYLEGNGVGHHKVALTLDNSEQIVLMIEDKYDRMHMFSWEAAGAIGQEMNDIVKSTIDPMLEKMKSREER
ncbi:hypothetical protein [Paenibacillus ferrarius]|nr:hypothetical protein [Paenibacillus ferrarius]